MPYDAGEEISLTPQEEDALDKALHWTGPAIDIDVAEWADAFATSVAEWAAGRKWPYSRCEAVTAALRPYLGLRHVRKALQKRGMKIIEEPRRRKRGPSIN